MSEIVSSFEELVEGMEALTEIFRSTSLEEHKELLHTDGAIEQLQNLYKGIDGAMARVDEIRKTKGLPPVGLGALTLVQGLKK